MPRMLYRYSWSPQDETNLVIQDYVDVEIFHKIFHRVKVDVSAIICL